jgi:hypothetical protein
MRGKGGEGWGKEGKERGRGDQLTNTITFAHQVKAVKSLLLMMFLN